MTTKMLGDGSEVVGTSADIDETARVEAAVQVAVDKMLMVRGNRARMQLVEATVAAATRVGLGGVVASRLMAELIALGVS